MHRRSEGCKEEPTSNSSDRHQDQLEALLERTEDADTDVEKPSDDECNLQKTPAASRIATRHVWRAGLMAVSVLLVLVVAYALLSHRSGSSRIWDSSTADEPPSTNNGDGYVLDTNWDFYAKPTTREYLWKIQDVKYNPDGVYRPMMLINGQFPGPLIECNEGDTIVVHIDNQAVNATSIHWHGIYQNGANWMDGTVGITQCPIAPSASFTYRFKIENQSGTYWYHAHHGVQASDGLLGPLVVHSKDEGRLQRLQYATDRVILVQDHYHDPSSALLMDYLKPGNENAEPVPDGALINGVNVRDCDSLPHRRCDNTSLSLPTFNLTPNENHRLRIINVGAFAEFQMQIDEHQFAVTEVDGADVEPVYYHRLNISPGQRYSIVLRTNTTTADSFWLRARMITACFAEENPYMEPEVRAIIHYSSEDAATPQALPKSKDWAETVELECRDMNTTELVPTQAIAAPPKADASFYLRSNFEIGAWRLSRGFFNSSSWRPDVYSPSLERVIDGYSTRNQSFTSTTTGINSQAFDTSNEFVLQVPGTQVIDILISNFDDGNHPLHLHGYKYFVLAQGHGYFEPGMYDTIDLSNPLRRDTASIEAFGWLLIRLVTDNPGMWAFHCHISWHTEAGLMMQLLVQPEVVGKIELPEANRDLCKAEGLDRGAGPKDEIWTDCREACDQRGLPLPSFMHPDIFRTSHPEEYQSEVRVVLMSSFRDADFPSKKPMIRKQHIPVWPTASHPEYTDQLQLKTGRMHNVDSYVKTHETWLLPKAYFTFNTCKVTGEHIEFAPESVDYVESVAAEFDMYRRRDRFGA